jgi:hypothetical protein
MSLRLTTSVLDVEEGSLSRNDGANLAAGGTTLVLVGPSPRKRVAEVGHDKEPASLAMSSYLTNMTMDYIYAYLQPTRSALGRPWLGGVVVENIV